MSMNSSNDFAFTSTNNSTVTFMFNVTVSPNATSPVSVVVDACVPPKDAKSVWVAPPIDAWMCHRPELITLMVFYLVCLLVGQVVNWVCLTNLYKTKLTACSRYLMTVQCAVNTAYLSINFPYKITLLYLQHLFLPDELKIFCGWLHLFVIFTGMFLQDSIAITKVLYIVFPQTAKQWFSNRKKSLIPALVPMCFGFAYAAPSVYACCYRFYKFSTFAISYVGPASQTQLQFSITGSAILVATLLICYTWVFFKIRASSRAIHNGDDKKGVKKQKREIRVNG